MVPSFIISGTSSGSGKTTITLGLMAAFRDRGLRVQPFKCGPDFIDPGLHQLVTGTVSRNLDLFMCGEDFTRRTFFSNSRGADLAIIEGVMGMFDGGQASSGALAGFLDLPTILVLDVRSMAESAAAIVKGFETYRPEVAPKGVILNRIGSTRHLELVSRAILENCQAKILGHLPRNLEFAIPSRHLGLFTGDETPITEDARNLLAKTIAQHVDLDGILALCGEPAAYAVEPIASQPKSCRIAIARDKAFCFYYQDNFDLLQEAGAELVFFSPLHDEQLPQDIDGIYLGGGYPELYARDLSGNTTMRQAMREWIEHDGPVYAECGGFMYLTQEIVDGEGLSHPMVGIFPVVSRMQKSRFSLGYREVKTALPSILGPAGVILRGHEFHYSTIDTMPSETLRAYTLDSGVKEGYCYRRTLGGYIHLHFGSSPSAAQSFINFCRE